MKILVVVDMQNDFIDGALGTPEAQAIVPKVCDYIREHAARDTYIIFTKDSHYDDYMDTLEGKNLPVPHCIIGTDGWKINKDVVSAFEDTMDTYCVEPIYPFDKEDLIINKPTFGSTMLQDMIYHFADNGVEIEEVTLMGLCTGICVLSNAILLKSTLFETPIKVVEDCCACVTPESHKTALEAMKLCQIEII